MLIVFIKFYGLCVANSISKNLAFVLQFHFCLLIFFNETFLLKELNKLCVCGLHTFKMSVDFDGNEMEKCFKIEAY